MSQTRTPKKSDVQVEMPEFMIYGVAASRTEVFAYLGSGTTPAPAATAVEVEQAETKIDKAEEPRLWTAAIIKKKRVKREVGRTFKHTSKRFKTVSVNRITEVHDNGSVTAVRVSLTRPS